MHYTVKQAVGYWIIALQEPGIPWINYATTPSKERAEQIARALNVLDAFACVLEAFDK